MYAVSLCHRLQIVYQICTTFIPYKLLASIVVRPFYKVVSNSNSLVPRSSTGNLRRLKELLRKSENRICADCGAPDPKWA